MKFLEFTFRGEIYQVDESGRIRRNKSGEFSDTWIFLGGSKHHQTRSPDIYLEDVFNDPEKLNSCLGWDRDHGTVRTWRGSYMGKNPRITNVKLIDIRLSIDDESVDIYLERGEDQDQLPLCYWIIDEVIEDPALAFTIANAVHLYYTDPLYILEKVGSGYELKI